MNSLQHMARALTRAAWPPFRAPDDLDGGTTPIDTTVSRTEQLREILRQRGPQTSQQLAEAVDLMRNSLVGALLAQDIRRGSVRFEDGRYAWQRDWDDQLHADLRSAAALLRRHGWKVAAP